MHNYKSNVWRSNKIWGLPRRENKGTFVQNVYNFWTENIHGSYFDGVVNYYLMETILDRFGRIVIPKKYGKISISKQEHRFRSKKIKNP